MGFILRTTAAPIGISSGDDLASAQQALTEEIGAAITDVQPQLVVGPSPHDAHHGHEVVGRATHAALAHLGRRPRWWIWTLWSYAPTPSLFVELDASVLTRVLDALEAHRGELARADYGCALRARSELAAVLGIEQVFGWGSVGGQATHAEVLTELLTDRFDGWPLARPRRPEFPAVMSGGIPSGCDLDHWLRARGPRAALVGPPARPRGQRSPT